MHTMRKTLAEWLRSLADKLDPPDASTMGGGGPGPVKPK